MSRDLARRIKKLEIAYAKELEGDREIRIVWKQPRKIPAGRDPSAVPTTSDSTPRLTCRCNTTTTSKTLRGIPRRPSNPTRSRGRRITSQTATGSISKQK